MEAVLLREELGLHDWVRELEGFNIRYVEQLAALFSTFKGRMALGQLTTPPPKVAEMRKKVDRVMIKRHHVSFGTARVVSPATGFVLRPQTFHGLGLKLPPLLKYADFGDTLPTAAAMAALGPSRSVAAWSIPSPAAVVGPGTAASPPAHVDLKPILTPIRNQFHRGTCVAFTTAALLEAQILLDTRQQIDLSEQYVYSAARQNDPDLREDGTYPQYALDGLLQRGACLERLWPYNAHNDWGQSLTFHAPNYSLKDLDTDAQAHRITGYSTLLANDVDDVKLALVRKQPVAIGVPVYKDAWFNGFTEMTGELQMPLTRPNSDGTETLLDTVSGGHAVPLIGYRDTPDPNNVADYRPGGGYFIFKNSWGTTWASSNANDGPGFGILPYAYLVKYNTFAYVIEIDRPAEPVEVVTCD
jgi:hypothetical protein